MARHNDGLPTPLQLREMVKQIQRVIAYREGKGRGPNAALYETIRVLRDHVDERPDLHALKLKWGE